MDQDAAQLRNHRLGRRGGQELGAAAGERLAGRRVALTGGGGFIGSHVAAAFVAAGADVLLLGPAPLKRPEVAALVARGRVRYIPDALGGGHRALSAALAGCDSLVHLNYHPTPAATFLSRMRHEVQLNLMETIDLLEACESEVAHVCFASSTAVYTPPGRGVAEDGPVGGDVSPYALVKLAQEACVRSWSARDGRTSAILRLATVYGPGETVRRAIPNFIRAVLAGERPVVDGRGAAPFDLIYVADVAEAVLRAVESNADGIFNIGSGQARTPAEVARLVARLCDAEGDVVEDHSAPDRGGAICDTTAARDRLGFQPATSLEEGLRVEIGWMRDELLRRTA